MTLMKLYAWQQWRHRHREQTCGPGEGSEEEGEGETIGESSMEAHTLPYVK